MKVNLAVDLSIEAFSGANITDYDSGATNTIVINKSGKPIVTQRPSLEITEDSTTLTLNNRGRGIYYWENNSKLYIVHDNNIYANNQQPTSIVAAITTGSEAVTIVETIGTPRLVILDAENNQGWTMNAGETVAQITSTNFPTTLAHGGVILDGYLFVMDEDGVIYNSEPDDPTTFLATSFIQSERENDKGIYLGKQNNRIISFNTRTIEILYNANNTSGSPLNRQQNISYNIGCASGLSVWEDGDVTYFIGSSPSGQMGVYKLDNLRPTIISTDSINSYITEGLTNNNLRIRFSGLTAMGHSILIMTAYVLDASSQILPKLTITYDSVTKQWGFWKTSINGINNFPLMAWTKRTGGHNKTVSPRTGEGIFYNGDIVNIKDNLIPVDILSGVDGVFESGVFESGVFEDAVPDSGNNIDTIIRTGLIDGDVSAYKFQNRETVEMENTPSSQTLTIKHSDEESSNFDSGNIIDTSDDRKEVYAGGRFMKRNYQIEYSGNEQFFIEYLDADIEAGL